MLTPFSVGLKQRCHYLQVPLKQILNCCHLSRTTPDNATGGRTQTIPIESRPRNQTAPVVEGLKYSVPSFLPFLLVITASYWTLKRSSRRKRSGSSEPWI